MNLEEKIMDIMCEVFDLEQISTDVSQKTCDRWDSLRHLTLASELEEAFDIDLEPEEIAEMTDFSRVVNMIQEKL